jgi:Flp pilus assembly protein TadG
MVPAPSAPQARQAPPPRGARSDRGAAAVEFALLLPLLLVLVFGIIDFGRALNAQITLTQAAREGARLASLKQPNVVPKSQAAASPLTGVGVAVTACPAAPTPGADATVQTSYTFEFLTPVGAIAAMFGGGGFGDPIVLTAQGVMPCEA